MRGNALGPAVAGQGEAPGLAVNDSMRGEDAEEYTRVLRRKGAPTQSGKQLRVLSAARDRAQGC